MNVPAFLRREERGYRFRYRHSVAGASRITGIPEEWISLWIETGLLRSQNWLKYVWVRLEDVQELLNNARKWITKFVPVLPLEPINPARMREIEVELSRLDVSS